jgi:hypothetical protein
MRSFFTFVKWRVSISRVFNAHEIRKENIVSKETVKRRN